MAAAPVISEFCADNATLIADADGDFPDWIEIHNPDAAPVDLGGYALTDSAGNLDRWQFPTGTVLEPGEFLIVFASDKKRDVAGLELHTNFKLSAGGEYLALVAPGGTVLQEFAPEYPPLAEDESYGVVFESTTFVAEGAASETFVPTDGVLGTTWTEPGFDPGGTFQAGTTGAGYGIDVPGMTVRHLFSTGPVRNLAAVDALLAGQGLDREFTEVAPVVNYLDTGGSGNFSNDSPYPGGGGDNFALVATGTVIIPEAGEWTFGSNSDDGGRIRVGGTDILVDDNLHGTLNNFGTVSLGAGRHTVEYVMFENGGGASGEFFAARGRFTSFNEEFKLVGDTADGGLEVRTSPRGSAVGGFVGTRLAELMPGRATSAYVRVPFSVADPSAFTSFSLQMRYSDGFVAYINGVRVAVSNARLPSTWDSAAIASRPDPLVPESFSLPAAGLLVAGEANVLAVHGMSRSLNDDAFLVLPELVGGGIVAGGSAVFEVPTPGGINTGPTNLGSVLDTKFEPDRGFYTGPVEVSITTGTPGASIYYTTDGSEPGPENGTLYTGPLPIAATTPLRAMATKPGFLPTDIDTHTYIFLDDVLTQPESAPPGWPSEEVNGQVFDYGMDPEIVNGTDPATGGATRVRDALTALPTLAVNLPLESLVDPRDGIYVNAGRRGFAWERAASLELIYPEGYANPDGRTDGFQVGCGLRIRGGFSRSGNNPKHSFRLFFRSQYGAGKLRYPMFGDEGADEFDALDLRGAQNYAWAFSYDRRNTFLRDVWSRDVQREMGQPYTRSRYYHLYLNGVYWGMCQTEERPEADYAETYFGGDEEDYDVVKSFGNNADGNRDSYGRLHAKYELGFVDDAAFYDILGRDPSGNYDPVDHEHLIDLENLIDYMALTYFSGDRDGPGSRFTRGRPNNYFGIYNRNSPAGFQFFEHDSEHSLGTGDRNMVEPFTTSEGLEEFNPHTLHERLAGDSALYRRAFADRLEKHLAPGGALHEDSAIALLDRRAASIDTAIIAHSARWGDSKQEPDRPPRDRDDWLRAVEEIRSFIRGRDAELKAQLRAVGWIPDLDAPRFLQHGGYISSTEEIFLGGTAGTIYLTREGSDPQGSAGAPSGSASVFTSGSAEVRLVSAGARWKFLAPVTAAVPGWETTGFDDGAWSMGDAPLGYGDPGLTPVEFVEDGAGNKNLTTYFRHRFTVADPTGITGLALGVRRDDGAAVYLNGTEVARTNLPSGPITFETPASAVTGGAGETEFQQFDLDPAGLVGGENVLAVEVHQVSGSSSDVSFDLDLRATRSTTSTPTFLEGPGEVLVRTRALDSDEWSPLNEAWFFVDLTPASGENLQVSELSYRPAAPSPEEVIRGFTSRDDFEFIELRNTSSDHVHLRGLTFSDGVRFTFDDASAHFFVVPPGGYVVLVSNERAFRFRHGDLPNIAGEFRGGLDNGGETLRLDGVVTFSYDDDGPWPESPDGGGASLVYRGGDPSEAASWSASLVTGGSPGSGGGTLTYAGWKAGLGISAPDGSDDDRDGLTLFAEYAFGGDPAVPDRFGVAFENGRAELTCPRREGAGDVVFQLQASDSLGVFTTVAAAPAEEGDRVRFVLPAGAGVDTRFFRVRVSLP